MAREMKDSGIAWIGEIPKDWNTIKVKYAASITNGADPQNEGEIPVYGSGAYSFKTCGEYKEGPTVLLGRKGATLHIPHYIEGKYWNVDTAFDVKTNISKLNLRFFYYLAICFDYKCYISQTTLPGMTQSNYENIQIPCPTIQEKVKIYKFIDKKCAEIDAVLEKTRASIEEYKKLKQTIITHAVTKGVRGDRSMKESGSVWFGFIPADWEMCKTKRLATIEKRIAGTEGLTVLSITQKGIRPKDLSKNEGQLAADYSNYQIVHRGDFAMNHMDLLTGWIDISHFEGVTSPDYRVFTMPDNDNVNKRYYLYLFQMCYFNRIYYGLGQGVSGLGRWRLPAKQFLDFLITAPPIDEQNEIVEYLDHQCTEIDALIQKKEQLLAELGSYKKSIIYEYVTGKKEAPQI